jgi:hypothetical protein
VKKVQIRTLADHRWIRLLSVNSRAARPYHQKCFSATVPHGGRDLMPWGMAAACRREVWRQMYICRNFWFDHLFSKIEEKIF